VANTVTAFLETLVATSGDYNAAKVGKLSFLDGVYKDVKPEVGRNGKTVQVYFPDVGAFTDQQANDWSPEDINPNYIDVVFNQRPGKAILIRDFEQWQTATDIIEKFLDPCYKRGLEYFNGQLSGLITEDNFNSNATIIGTTDGTVTVGDAANAWGSLATAKVPVSPEDSANLSLFEHTRVYQSQLTDAAWSQENVVGAVIAQRARETGDLGGAFNFTRRWDQQAPTKTNAITGTVTATAGSTAVTGSGTSFTTDVIAGDRLTFTGDSTGQTYRVLSVTDDTHLTLAIPFAGTTGAAKTATQKTYLNLAMHRYAVALAVRPLELINQGEIIQSRIIMLKGIPFRVMFSYQHLKGGWLMTIDCGCAVKVLRPDFGVIIKS
jgi:hypothetical protein